MFYIKHYKSGQHLPKDYCTFDAAMDAAQKSVESKMYSTFYGVTFQIFKTGDNRAWGEV
jgi:hypothetical protein